MLTNYREMFWNRCDKEIAQLARESGVRRNELYKWKAECDSRGDSAFPGSGKKPIQPNTDDAAAMKAEIWINGDD